MLKTLGYYAVIIVFTSLKTSIPDELPDELLRVFQPLYWCRHSFRHGGAISIHYSLVVAAETH